MQICRICLAADRKMYPMVSELVHIYEHVTGLPFSSEDLLPKYVCWECGHYMSKYVAFKRRAMMSYCTLIEILDKDRLITMSSIENCSQSTLTHTSTVYLFVQEEYDNLENYDNVGNIVDIKEESNNNFEDEKDETLLSDDILVSSLNIEGTDSRKENSLVENQSPADIPSVKRKRKAKASKIIKDENNSSGNKEDEILSSDDILGSSPNVDGTHSIEENQSPAKLSSVKRKKKASEIITDKKNSSEKSKKSNKIIKLIRVKRKKVSAAMEKKKDVKLMIDKLDKELLHVTVQTVDEQIAEIQNRKESDNYLNSPLTCEHCFKGFIGVNAFDRHMVKHSESKGPHVCPLCKMRFRLHCKLKIHMNLHLYKISCTKCNFSTNYLTAAKNHQNYHEGKTYQCPHCKEVIAHKSSYLSHLRIKHPSDIICKLCGYSFLNEQGLKQHISRYHRNDPQVPLDGPECARCDIRFSCQDALDTHRRVSAHHSDERNAGMVKPLRNSTQDDYPRPLYSNASNSKNSKPFPNGPEPCQLCDKLLPTPKAYKSHMKEHKRKKRIRIKKPRMCEICGKLCKAYSDHKKVHMNNKTIGNSKVCEICGESYTAYSAHKKAHMKNETIGNNKMCEICGESYTSAVYLRSHMRKHSSTKDFKCDLCGKLYQSYRSLYLHRKNHCGVRVDHPCSVCGKTFSSPNNLSRHIQLHKGLSFQCEFCGKEFRCQDNKKQHVDHVHKMKPWIRRNRVPRKQAEVSNSTPETVEQNPSETEADVHEEYTVT